jgi:hypothetical protein
MVKRTLTVLGILTLMVMVNTAGAFLPAPWTACEGNCAPLFVSVDCKTPEPTTIIKTWAIKIEGPCPAPGMACGSSCDKGGFSPGMLCSAANAIATPLDFLFGGFDGVYGCFGGNNACKDSSCGPCFGPIPAVVAAVPMALGAPTVMFGSLW